MPDAKPANCCTCSQRHVVPRRILIVSDEMEVGGSQRQIAHLLSGLPRGRWQPELLYFRTRSFLVDQIEATGLVCHCLSKRGRFDVGFAWRLIRHMRRRRYELVHAFSLTAEFWLRLVRPFVPRFVFIASARDLCEAHTRGEWLRKRWVLRGSDAIIANSRAGARITAQRNGIPSDRFDVIANGVALPQPAISPPRETSNRTSQRTVALFAGRLVEQKNVSLLLRACARLPPAQRPYLLLAGSGPLEAHLRHETTALDLGADVCFLGERRDLLVLAAAADFLVLPSNEEGLSNVLLEAMAAGCAVVASDVGGNSELIDDGRTGLLFPARDVERLGQAVARLASDAPLRASLAGNAYRNVVENYSIETMVARTEAVYARCLKNEGRMPPPLTSADNTPATPNAASSEVPLRILLMLESHFPATGGGAESQVQTLALRMRHLGHRVTILTRGVPWGSQARIERYRGIVICRLPYPHRWRYLGSLVLWSRLAVFLWRRRHRYAAWHAHIAHYLAAIACLVGRIGQVPVVVKIAGSWEFEEGLLAPGKGAFTAAARACLKHAAALQATSRRIAAMLAERGFPREHIAVLSNAVDMARFDGPRTPRAPAQPLTAVFVGRFVREKGLGLLLQAWARAYALHSHMRLLMVGEGPLDNDLRAQARSLGIAGQIEFAGHHAAVETFLARADFGLLPSLIEGMSNTLLECMASGLPMLASRVSGSEDLIVTGRNGWLFEPGDVDALTAHLIRIANLPQSRLRALGEQARIDVERAASMDNVVARLLALYRGTPPMQLCATDAIASPARMVMGGSD
jgi:glycosyltransferase involved in cell wall biosynthesis